LFDLAAFQSIQVMSPVDEKSVVVVMIGSISSGYVVQRDGCLIKYWD
jgi:hypothetical protein